MKARISQRFRDKIFNEYVAVGLKNMARSTVVICCIVRDCGDALQANIPQIEELRKKFRDSRVIIVENDSKDNTKEVLSNWLKSTTGLTVISHDYHVNPLPVKKADQTPSTFFTRHRIALMAGYRNQYLDAIEKLDIVPDYMIVLDADVDSFSLKGVCNSFGQPIRWDAITANGIGVIRAYGGMYRYYVYYDAYALRKSEEFRPQTINTMVYTQHIFTGLTRGMPMIRVSSAFSGMAIYRMEAVKGARYVCDENFDPEVNVLCEHVGFHRQMFLNGFGRIFLNPSLELVYETILQSYMAAIARIIPRIKSMIARSMKKNEPSAMGEKKPMKKPDSISDLVL